MRLSGCLISALSILFSLSSSGQQPNDQQSGGKFANVFGARIHYVDVGSGPAVVLLHGLADDVGVWGLVMPALAAKHRGHRARSSRLRPFRQAVAGLSSRHIR